MPAQTTKLFPLEDLEDVSTTKDLARGDLDALRAVANRITSFMARPHKDLGRAGPVCPFVPLSLEHKTLWLAAEHVGGRSVRDVVDLVSGYQELFLSARPTKGDDAIYNSSFRPFTAPVPFLLIRQAVVSDWKFFLDNEAWLKLWVQRYGASGAEALAQELRRLPWRTRRE